MHTSTSDFKPGEQVIFGTPNGAKTLGTVIKVNRKRCKVRQDEARNSRPVGTVWNVPPQLMEKVSKDADLRPLPQPKPARKATSKAAERRLTMLTTRPGMEVSFLDKQGRTIKGIVQRVNRKTASVNPLNGPAGGYYRVPFSLLRAA